MSWPTWISRAACVRLEANPLHFDRIDNPGDALSYCASCPVTAECKTFVVPKRSTCYTGIAGGIVWVNGERQRLPPAACGTQPAKNRHRRNREKCGVCWPVEPLADPDDPKREGWSDDDLRQAHANWSNGDRGKWACDGERIYQRLRRGKKKPTTEEKEAAA